MKKFGLIILLSIAIILLYKLSDYINHHKESIPIELKYVFINHQGQTILSNDGSSVYGSQPIESISTVVIDNNIQHSIGDSINLYEESLSIFDAKYLILWVDGGKGFIKQERIDLDQLTLIDLTKERSDKLELKQKVIDDRITHQKRSHIYNPSDREEGTEGATFAKARHEQWLSERGGHIDISSVRASRKRYNEQLNSIRESSHKDADITGWDWLGPGNIGGRSRSFAIKPSNPNVMFFGSVAGGLWRSDDAGSTWAPVDDFWSSLAVTDIVFDQVNDNIIYVATGEYGSFNTNAIGVSSGLPGEGIYRSTNGGATWNQLNNTLSWTWIPRLATVPGKQNEIYAIVANGGNSGISSGGFIAKSTDGGLTWPNIVNTNTLPQSITINPNNTEQLVVGCIGELFTNISGQFNSTNFIDIIGQGSNPIPSNRNNRFEVYFGPNSLYVMTYINNSNNNISEIWKSTNNGVTWTNSYSAVNSIINQGDYCMSLWVDPNNDQNVIAGGLDIWSSDNGGQTFSIVSDRTAYRFGTSAHADQHFITHHPDDSSIIYASNDGGIQTNNDIFPSNFPIYKWQNLANASLGVLTLTSAAVSIDGTICIGGAHDNSISYGNNSSIWVQPFRGDGGQTLISHLDDQVMYGTTQYFRLRKTIDGGVTWCTKAEGLDGSGNARNSTDFCDGMTAFQLGEQTNFYPPLEMDSANDQVIYTGAKSLFRSIDGSETFSSVKSPISSNNNISTIEVSQSNPNIVWVGYNDGVIASTFDITAGTPNWNNSRGNGVPNAYIMDIAIHPRNSSIVAVVVGGYRGDQIWMTENSGQTWTDISNNLPPVHINSVLWHPVNENFIYLGSDLGVYASEDQGQNWNVDPLYTGHSDGPANTQVSELFWQGDGSNDFPYYLCAATSGRGLWRSSDLFTQDFYVDKNYFGIERGTENQPFNTFSEAYDEAIVGSTIYFLSSGDHNEFPPAFTIRKKIKIKLDNGNIPIVLK